MARSVSLRRLSLVAIAFVLACVLYAPESRAQCATSGPDLCLNANRFKVNVVWTNPYASGGGTGTAVALTSDTGYFWFFGASNVELVVKILDGRGVNGHFWFFSGALTDVQYTFTITDTTNGQVKTYNIPGRTPTSFLDQAMF